MKIMDDMEGARIGQLKNKAGLLARDINWMIVAVKLPAQLDTITTLELYYTTHSNTENNK